MVRSAIKDTLKHPKAFMYCDIAQKNLTIKQFRKANEGIYAEPATSDTSSVSRNVSSVPLE